jgi:REP element-mobilizing transposase RayT
VPRPRRHQVSVDATPYYHCVSRCVRRAFLCGFDALTGTSYEHRRGWVEQRIVALGQIFCIDVCAYAVMSNHYHLVLYINAQEQAELSSQAVLQRWFQLFKGNYLVKRYLQSDVLTEAEGKVVQEIAEKWRHRLGNISWFMKVLNERIAREANAEDLCTGKFWECRFKSQALLDDQALLACMTYVDLNPIRARLAKTPETSNYTSAQKRIRALQAMPVNKKAMNQSHSLLPFVGNPRMPMPIGLPFDLKEYLQLLDWTGRSIRLGKRGTIPNNVPTILERLNIGSKNWLYNASHFEESFRTVAGILASVRQKCPKLGYRRMPKVGLLVT